MSSIPSVPATLTPETVQLAILAELDKSADGTIPDSRALVISGTSMNGPAEQLLVKGAVESLDRKEVRRGVARVVLSWSLPLIIVVVR